MNQIRKRVHTRN